MNAESGTDQKAFALCDKAFRLIIDVAFRAENADPKNRGTLF